MIYIYFSPLTFRIRDVNLEVAVPLTPNPASPYVAVGIEICECPKEYGGLSCQVPNFVNSLFFKLFINLSYAKLYYITYPLLK